MATSERTRSRSGPDPIAKRIRDRRLERKLSFSGLGRQVGVAGSHIFHVENGEKLPSEGLAVRLARALDDDVELYRAWVRAVGKSSFHATLEAAAALQERLRVVGAGRAGGQGVVGGAGEIVAVSARSAPAAESPELATSDAPARGPARVLVTVIAGDEDPGPGPRPRGVTDTLRLDPGALGALEALEHPFAMPLAAPIVRRVADALPERGWAILTRRVLPLVPHAIHAVHIAGRLTLARVLWNGTQLLVLPAAGDRDFTVLEAPDEPALARLLAGRVVAVRLAS